MSEMTEKTLSVPEAGKRYFGLGKNASYDAAHRGEIPTIRIGSRLRVPVVALERMLAGTAPADHQQSVPISRRDDAGAARPV